jgi:hypothetical protein
MIYLNKNSSTFGVVTRYLCFRVSEANLEDRCNMDGLPDSVRELQMRMDLRGVSVKH